MSVEILARVQFALTIAFHYIFPTITIGLGLILVIMEGIYLRTRNPLYEQMTRFWVRIFALNFAVGVATGIVMEFEFGTNWSTYSRYVGDVFGSALAAEGIFAFFLESGFLAILVFGWDRVKPGIHFLSTVMVAIGSTFSAVWIVIANSWMQTPAGYHIVGEGSNARAEITDFWAMVFNPSSMDRLAHVIVGCWLTGAFLVTSVSAFYILKQRHLEFARASMKIGLLVGAFASLLQLAAGHDTAVGVANNQPVKMAALEGHFDSSQPLPIGFFGWVDVASRQTHSVGIPGMGSWMVYGDPKHPFPGLGATPERDWPPVAAVFQTYHLMVAIGFGLIGLSWLGMFLWWRGKLWTATWVLKLFVIAVIGPQVANQLGWFTAELGRQPWIVYNLLRTSDGVSKVVSANQILGSIIMFGFVYLLLGALYFYLLDKKIRLGPVADDHPLAGKTLPI